MKNITHLIALTAALSLATVTTVMAEENAAAPANNGVSSEVKDARKDVRKSRRELRKAKKHLMQEKKKDHVTEGAGSAPVESTPSQ